MFLICCPVAWSLVATLVAAAATESHKSNSLAHTGCAAATTADLSLLLAHCKCADDTYVIIPASNSHTRTQELEHIEAWSKANNLTLNCNKSFEIIFTPKKCKVTTSVPPPLPGKTRCSTLKILGVTITNSLSVAEHVQDIIKLSSQTLHALRILHSLTWHVSHSHPARLSGSSCCQAQLRLASLVGVYLGR